MLFIETRGHHGRGLHVRPRKGDYRGVATALSFGEQLRNAITQVDKIQNLQKKSTEKYQNWHSSYQRVQKLKSLLQTVKEDDVENKTRISKELSSAEKESTLLYKKFSEAKMNLDNATKSFDQKAFVKRFHENVLLSSEKELDIKPVIPDYLQEKRSDIDSATNFVSRLISKSAADQLDSYEVWDEKSQSYIPLNGIGKNNLLSPNFDIFGFPGSPSKYVPPRAKTLPDGTNILEEGWGVRINAQTDVKTIIHEYGHFLESISPSISANSKTFLDKYAKSASIIDLSEKYPDRGFHVGDMAYDGNFIDPYVGRIYKGSRAAEVFAMGIQKLYEDPITFYANHPDHFLWTVANAKGILERPPSNNDRTKQFKKHININTYAQNKSLKVFAKNVQNVSLKGHHGMGLHVRPKKGGRFGAAASYMRILLAPIPGKLELVTLKKDFEQSVRNANNTLNSLYAWLDQSFPENPSFGNTFYMKHVSSGDFVSSENVDKASQLFLKDIEEVCAQNGISFEKTELLKKQFTEQMSKLANESMIVAKQKEQKEILINQVLSEYEKRKKDFEDAFLENEPSFDLELNVDAWKTLSLPGQKEMRPTLSMEEKAKAAADYVTRAISPSVYSRMDKGSDPYVYDFYDSSADHFGPYMLKDVNSDGKAFGRLDLFKKYVDPESTMSTRSHYMLNNSDLMMKRVDVVDLPDISDGKWINTSSQIDEKGNETILVGYRKDGKVPTRRPGIHMLENAFLPSYVHEIAHHIEFQSADISASREKFISRRIGENPSLEKLKDIYPNSSYDDGETTFKDDFIDAYIGKKYTTPRTSEAFSMGLQYLFQNPVKFARDDPDMAMWVISACKGIPTGKLTLPEGLKWHGNAKS